MKIVKIITDEKNIDSDSVEKITDFIKKELL